MDRSSAVKDDADLELREFPRSGSGSHASIPTHRRQPSPSRQGGADATTSSPASSPMSPRRHRRTGSRHTHFSPHLHYRHRGDNGVEIDETTDDDEGDEGEGDDDGRVTATTSSHHQPRRSVSEDTSEEEEEEEERSGSDEESKHKRGDAIGRRNPGDGVSVSEGAATSRKNVNGRRKTSLPLAVFGSRKGKDQDNHQRPLLDNYDRVDAWRTRTRERPVEDSDHLDSPNGKTQETNRIDVADVDYDFELRRQGVSSSRRPSRSDHARAYSPSPSRHSVHSIDPRLATATLGLYSVPVDSTDMHVTHRIPQPRKYQDINPEAPDELPPTKPAPVTLLKPKRKRKKVHLFYKTCDILWNAFIWHFPRTMFPLAPAVILFMVAAILAGFFYVYYDVQWTGTRSWRWMAWAGSVVVMLVGSNYLFAILMWLLKRLIFETKLFYYINTVTSTLTVFASCTILKGWDSTPRWWIQKILISMLVISILYFFVILGTKYLIVKLHREQFWKSISKYLISERIIWKMAYGIRHKEAIKRHFKPSVHQFQNAWHWILDKHANPNVDVAAYDIGTGRSDIPLEHSASIAKVILKNLDTFGKGYLEEEDFERFFEYEDDVQAALRLFPRGQVIDLSLITEVVHRIHKDRKSLYKTLFDRENAGRVLTYIINTFFAIIMVFVVLLIFDVSLTQYLIPLGTFFLGFSFIFGTSLKNLWEGVVLIFAVRPFDIGDRITLPGTTYPTLIVSKISLFTTTFFATDGRCFIIPNQQLYTMPITQYKRSKNYAVQVSVHLDFNTPAEKIILLRERVYEWMKQDSAPWLIRTDEDWMFWVDIIENNNKITVMFWIELQDVNWQAPRFYLVPKSNLYLAVQRVCEELGVMYHLPPQPVILQKDDTQDMEAKSSPDERSFY